MSLWRKFLKAVFTGEKDWAWRRRMCFAGCAVFLWATVYSIVWTMDTARMTSILGFVIPAFSATLATYLGFAGYDAHKKRETERLRDAAELELAKRKEEEERAKKDGQ